MRVGLVVYGSLDTLTGGYLYDRKLAEHLAAHGDDVEVVSLPGHGHEGVDTAADLVAAELRRFLLRA